MYEEYLKADGITVKQLDAIEAEVTAEVERATEQALQSRDKMPPGESALQGVYAKHGR
jgi:TPP-dependent pyruvate/acetoin dehydrogenase alpha subunit